MRLSGLLPLLGELADIRHLLAMLEEAEAGQLHYGMLPAARAYLVSLLASRLGRPMLVLAPDSQRAEELFAQMKCWLEQPARAFFLPDPDTLAYERAPRDVLTIRERVRSLAALAHWQPGGGAPPPIIVASARGVLAKTMPPEAFRAHTQKFALGQRIGLEETLTAWYGMGYQPHSVVELPGSFSRRGGIVDIFPPSEELPVRLELFGDEIETMRHFDPTTQRSLEKVEAFTVAPASEALAEGGAGAATRFSRLSLDSCQPVNQGELHRDLERLRGKEHFLELDFYIPYLYREPSLFLDYLPPQGLVIIEDWPAFQMKVEALEEEGLGRQEELIRRGEIPAGILSGYLTWDDLQERLASRPTLILSPSLDDAPPPEEASFAPGRLYGGQLKRAVADVLEQTRRGGRVVLVSRQAPRLAELLQEAWHHATPVEEIGEIPPPQSLTLVQGALAAGWNLREGEGLNLLTDAELFGWAVPQPRPPVRRPQPTKKLLAELAPGDYVVHIEHGVAVFQGLVKESRDGREQEYLLLEYAAGDKLYVPIYQADRVSRYIGAGEAPPHITRLGSADWEQVTARTRRAVKDIARELLALYAAREMATARPLSPDTPWQAELEASFPYLETPDQLRAIQEVKGDLERARPMDRLVCGDVGFGKTEVALRAAFKAVMDGRQVALLVPTTVLAQQHTQTFQKRLAPFPVAVEMASRFRTPQEMKAVLKGLAKGTVDIAIGTHRLLQPDVQFKDLGLLIIDEEQRFGVTHKEKIKELRQEVHILTLTATPIPRTLYMALTGLRDMSTIETPPEERLPIITRVGAFDENLVRQAVARELERGGQVYFVHNRVRGIRQVAARLARIVPRARLAIAHGQMKEDALEKVMLQFAAGDYDILVCTAIIESGLDIPNVNTLIANRADQFGLAQLYQLRGRVGRSSRRAYAYFLYNRTLAPNDTARARLETIVEASELGAGFNIAMRDLEIRGAGDILGARQHGHISAVGFDLYTRLLAQAIQELKAGPDATPKRPPTSTLSPLRESVHLALPLEAHLPEEYIGDENLRLELYRRLAHLANAEEAREMAQELGDRFGRPPAPAQNLLYVVRIKALAQEARLKAVSLADDAFLLRPLEMPPWHRALREGMLPAGLRVGQNSLRSPRQSGHRWQEELEWLLEELARAAAALPREPSPALDWPS